MGNFIKAKPLNDTTIELMENATAGDKINLKELANIDLSILTKQITETKDSVYKQMLEEERAKIVMQQQAVLQTERSKMSEDKQKELNSLNASLIKAQAEIKNTKLIIEQTKDNEIHRLESKLSEKDAEIRLAQAEKEIIKANTAKEYEIALHKKDIEINLLKEQSQKKKFELRIGTKDLGEDLESYCLSVYENDIRGFIPKATFEKYNIGHLNTEKNVGERGDFIYREKISDDYEISIMFEMKNRNDDSKTKNTNASKIEKMERDRRDAVNGECKYAVLVTMLEPEDEFAIKQIRQYKNTWMVRPQYFKQIIMWIREKEIALYEATRSISHELAILKDENKENLSFEQDLTQRKKEIFKAYKLLVSNFDDDAKDLVDIVKSAINIWKRRDTEKMRTKSVVDKTFKISSKQKESTELKELKAELKALNTKELTFGTKESKSKEVYALMSKTMATKVDNSEDDEE